MALAVARLHVGQAVERVRQRARFRDEHLERVDRERRLAAPGLRRLPDDADDVAEAYVDSAHATRVAQELDASRAVDEIEEASFPTSLAHHPSGEPPLLATPAGRAQPSPRTASISLAVGKRLGGVIARLEPSPVRIRRLARKVRIRSRGSTAPYPVESAGVAQRERRAWREPHVPG